MDTYSDSGNDSKVIRMWSRDTKEVIDDPLDDLLNEFGTENSDSQTIDWEDELFNDIDDSEIDRYLEKPQDYFYSLKSKESSSDDLENLDNLVHRAKYLSHKLKYYNTYLLNRE